MGSVFCCYGDTRSYDAMFFLEELSKNKLGSEMEVIMSKSDDIDEP